MIKIAVISLIWYFLVSIIIKLIAKVINKDAKVIANSLESVEDKNYTENTSKRISFKITPFKAIIICLIPIVNILFDIFLFIWIYMELLILVAMKNTKASL